MNDKINNNLRIFLFFIFIPLIIHLLTGCAPKVPPKHITTKDWNEATHQVVREYTPLSNQELKPYFKKAKVAYPPRKIALLTFKKEEKMELWGQDRRRSWHYIRTFPLKASSGTSGPKLKYHDGQIPEGIYNITMLNPFSSWQLSMLVNYPNHFDKLHAEDDGRTDLGGDIYIHGKELSVGCLAIGDEAISELFVLAANVGKQNIEVIIAPNDLRKDKPVTDLKHQPDWVPQLYSQITQALKPFGQDLEKDHVAENLKDEEGIPISHIPSIGWWTKNTYLKALKP